MSSGNPFLNTERRPHVDGLFDAYEVALSNRNPGIALEALRHDVSPIGLHYLLTHFDVPYVPGDDWQIEIAGRVQTAQALPISDIKALPARTLTVTLECAGNGRANMRPRYPSMPWAYEAVGTAAWTGTPLHHVLNRAGLLDDAVEISFIGADRGYDRGQEHAYGRSLKRRDALSGDVLLAWAMNGQPLPPQHGFPLRLIVPGWYGMASVKWLKRIEALAMPYDGFQQVSSYMYRAAPDAPSTPVTHMRVKSLLIPPGLGDFYSRHRMVEGGPIPLFGRAWSGAGVGITRVELGIDGAWQEARLGPEHGKFAWRAWSSTWNAERGEHVLSCRATDASGDTQPLAARWDVGGFGNNAAQQVHVHVR
jgi:DMSO/TMAO reductase YedYZ molybdopterin-dependent catalytic subunit